MTTGLVKGARQVVVVWLVVVLQSHAASGALNSKYAVICTCCQAARSLDGTP